MLWERYGTLKSHSNPIENGPGSLWEWYGIVAYHSPNGYYGEYMELYEIRRNPIENVQPSYGITMGLTHTIPIRDPMGNVWNFTKYVEIP